MTKYRWIGKEPSEKDGVRYWKLTFDAVGVSQGEVIQALDPLPEPFAGGPTPERFYTEEEMETLRRHSKPHP